MSEEKKNSDLNKYRLFKSNNKYTNKLSCKKEINKLDLTFYPGASYQYFALQKHSLCIKFVKVVKWFSLLFAPTGDSGLTPAPKYFSVAMSTPNLVKKAYSCTVLFEILILLR